MGTVDFNSRPFGLAIIAKPGREDNLFRFMSAFEVTFPARLVPPKLEVRNRTEDANL
jgi:amidase